MFLEANNQQELRAIFLFTFFFKVFIYLTVQGPRCSLQDFSVVAFKLLVEACRIDEFPDQGSNLGLLEQGVWASRPPRKALFLIFRRADGLLLWTSHHSQWSSFILTIFLVQKAFMFVSQPGTMLVNKIQRWITWYIFMGQPLEHKCLSLFTQQTPSVYSVLVSVLVLGMKKWNTSLVFLRVYNLKGTEMLTDDWNTKWLLW